MKNFAWGIFLASIVWMAVLGIYMVDGEREKAMIRHEANIENYQLKQEIQQKNRITKAKARTLVEWRR